MLKRPERHLIAALDIGSSKVTVLVAELSQEDELKVVAMGFAPSAGMVKGLIVNFDEAQKSIKKAVQNAEVMLGQPIRRVIASCSGSHVESLNIQGAVDITGPAIVVADVERAIEAAKKISLKPGQNIMHVLPQMFVVDQQSNLKEPVGMVGKHLQAYVHMVKGSSDAAHSILKCVEKSGLQLTDLVLSPLASALAVLTNDEKELGVCLIDIGAATTDIAVFVHGSLSFSASLPIGGAYVTNDIIHVLGTTPQCAEFLKIQYGFALKNMASEQDVVEAEGVAGGAPQLVPSRVLSEIIEARMEEIFTLVSNKLTEQGLKNYISAGLVLTGGGSKVPGSLELAADVFRCPSRLGIPQYVAGVNDSIYDPAHSTGVGLLMYAKLQQEVLPVHRSQFMLQCTWLKPVKEWFKRYF